MRIRGYDEDTEELSEDLENIAGDIADLTKIDGKGGITIFTDKTKNEFKSTYQILKEISQIWDELTDKQQAKLLEKLGGKRGAQSIAGLLEDFSSVEEAMQTMQNAAGSSDREMEIIRDSLEFKLNSLRETWVSMLQEFADRGAIGDFIDLLTSASEGVEKLTSDFGLLQTALVTLGTLWGTQHLGLASVKNGKMEWGTAGLSGLLSGHQKKSNIDLLENVEKKIHDAFGQTTDQPLSLISSDIKQIVSDADDASDHIKEFVTNLIDTKTGTQALNDVETELNNVKKSASGVGTFFKSIGASIVNMVASLAISAAISVLVEGIQRVANSYDELMEKVREFTQEYTDSNKQLTDYGKRIEELKEVMDSSTSTEQEVADATKELYTIQTDLISTYGSYADGIDLVNGKLETQLDLLKDIDKQSLQDTVNKIKNERSNTESAINLGRNLGVGFLNKEGKFNPNPYISESMLIGRAIQLLYKGITDKETSLGEAFFGDESGNRAVDNVKRIREEVEGFSRTIKKTKVDSTTLNFIKGLKTFNYDRATGNIKIKGRVEDVKQDILTLQKLLNEAGIENERLNNQLIKYSEDATASIEQNIEAYNDLLLNAIVNGDESIVDSSQQKQLEGYYNKLEELHQKYSDAILSSNDEDAKSYTEAYLKALDDIREGIESSGINEAFIDYFEQLYPELQNTIADWDIKKDIDDKLELEWDLSKYLKNTNFEDIKSDYFRILNNQDTVSDVELNRFEKLSEWAAEHNKDVIHLVESYKALDESVNNTASALESLSVVAPSFEGITTALSEQASQGFLSKETMNSLNEEFGELFQGFDYKTARFDKFKESIYKELGRLEKGGNVNLKLRPEIDTKELRDKGWKEIEDGVERELENGIATVFTSTYSNKAGTQWLNFTPIIVDPETGEYKGVLTPDELQKYAEDVIAGVRTDDKNLQIGAAFNTDIEAEKAAEQIHTLHEELHNLDGNIFLELQNSLYEFTENGVKLNAEALDQYNDILGEVAMTSARLKEADAVKKYQKEAKYLEELIGDNNRLRIEYDNGADALRQYVNSTDALDESLVQDINASMDQLQVLSEEINRYDMLEAQIRATTSTLNEYTRATETANQKDNFDTAHSMVASLKEAMKKGWTGTDEFKKGMEYIGGYNFDPNIMEYGENYDSTWVKQFEERITRAERYFTEDISGIYNFLDDAVQRTEHKMVDYVDNAYVINIDNVDEFAQKMDMSVSEAMDLLLATDEAWDFNIDFSSIEDGIVDGLHAIDEESENARTDLEKFGETIQKLKFQGYDTTELEAAYSEVASDIAPDFAIDQDISKYSSDSIRRWADSIVKEAENDISGVKIDFNADVKGLSSTIDELKEIKANAKIKGEFDETEYRHVSVVLQALLDQKHELESQSIMNLDTSSMSEGANGVLSVVQSYVKAYQDLENAQTLGVDDTQLQVAEQRVENIKEQLTNLDVTKLAELGIDTAEISLDADPTQLYETVTNIDVNKVGDKKEVKIDADSSPALAKLTNLTNTINGTHAEVEIDGKLDENFHKDLQDLINAQDFTVNIKVKELNNNNNNNNKGTSGISDARGGKITHASTNNLVGELGQELVARDGKYFTVGDNGAEMVSLKKGDIVFNAKQTAELLKNGRINSRGQIVGNSFVYGNAYDNSTNTHGAGDGGKAGTRRDNKKTKDTKKETEKKAKEAKKAAKQLQEVTKDTEESFDWIEVKLRRLQEAVESLNRAANNVYKTWSKRNKSLDAEIAKVTEELEAQEKAQKRYQKVWAKGQEEYSKGKGKKGVKISNKPKKKDYKSGTDSNGKTEYNTKQYNYDKKQYKKAKEVWATGKYQKKIEEGQIGDKDIEKIKNKYLVEAIKEYQELWEKGIAAQQEAEELRIQLSDLNKQKLDNLIKEWDELIERTEHELNLLDKYQTRIETMGYWLNDDYYNKQKSILNTQLDQKQAELINAVEKFNAWVDVDPEKGGLEKDSEAYNEALNQIYSIQEGCEDIVNQIAEIDKAQRELKWDKFDYLQEKLDDISNEAEFISELLSNRKLMDDQGNFNEFGMANLSMLTVQYDEAIRKMQDYQKERNNLEKEIAADPFNKDIRDRYQTVTNSLRDSGKEIISTMNNILSQFQESVNKNLESLKDLIDKYNDALSAAKDLYDFQKNVQNQTDNINSIQRQLQAYGGDDSEEGRKRRQELRKQLQDAEQQLQETEWDRYINQTSKMLDNLYNDYEEFLNAHLEDIEVVVQQAVTEINNGNKDVANGLKTILDKFGLGTDNFKSFLEGNSETLVSGMNNGKLEDDSASILTYTKSLKETITSWENALNNNEIQKKLFGESFQLKFDDKGHLLVSAMYTEPQSETNNNQGAANLITNTVETTKNTYSTKAAYDDAQPNGEGTALSNVNPKDTVKKAGEVFKKSKYFAKGKKKQSEYGALNSYLYGKNDGKVLTNDGLKALYKIFGVDNAKDLYTELKNLSEAGYNIANVKGFAKGSKSIPKKQMAWTQENGTELIFRSSDGAMLTPLNQGDMVFTAQMTQRLWELASGMIPNSLGGQKLPNISSNNNNTINNNNEIVISLPNVNDYESFKQELQNDSRFEKFIQEVTIGQAMGNNSLSKRKY